MTPIKLMPPHSAAELEARGAPYVPDAPSVAAIPSERASERPAAKSDVHWIDLTDGYIDGVISIARDDGRTVVLNDRGGKRSQPGLRLRIGARSATWYYSIDRLEKGTRTAKLHKLGGYDRGTRDEPPHRATWHIDVKAARDLAIDKAAAYGRGEMPDGETAALTFRKAFEDYCQHLQTKADNADKPARWRRNVKSLGDKYLLPKWGPYTLVEMSAKREAVGVWYSAIAKDAVTSAHHIRRIIRAVYNFKRKRGATLPADNPAMAPIDRQEHHKKKTYKGPRLPFDKFPLWLEAWRKLEPMHRAYHLTALLTGSRGGELARTTWADLALRKPAEDEPDKRRTLVIGNSKTESDIIIPLSAPIARALKLARDAARAEGIESEFIFPDAERWARDDLPATGHAMRRTYKSVASSLKILNETSGRLLGHQPPGVSADYDDPLALARSEWLRQLQRQVSGKVLALLGSDATREAIAPPPPSPRDVARTAGLLRYRGPCQYHGPDVERSVATGRCVQCVSRKNERQAPSRKASHRRGNPLKAATGS
jgi:hypothetical protein